MIEYNVFNAVDPSHDVVKDIEYITIQTQYSFQIRYIHGKYLVFHYSCQIP
jgi:hypothetical protein